MAHKLGIERGTRGKFYRRVTVRSSCTASFSAVLVSTFDGAAPLSEVIQARSKTPYCSCLRPLVVEGRAFA